ncbi:MAG: hypothetical protein HZA54_02060, partial [Planctomycetes bacterium]|nr:hypothetical protein [Planctomycetota bacterium]
MPVPIPAHATDDDLLGRLAVECGLLTEAQLRLVLAERERAAAPAGAPPLAPADDHPTGESAASPPAAPSCAAILLRRGFLSELSLHFLETVRAHAAPERARLLAQRKADLALARELLARGLLTPEQMNDCLSSQFTVEGSPYLPLPELIERRGLIGHEDLRAAMPAHSTRLLICKRCRAELTVFAYPFPVRHACRNSGAVLDTTALVQGPNTVEIPGAARGPHPAPAPAPAPVPVPAAAPPTSGPRPPAAPDSVTLGPGTLTAPDANATRGPVAPSILAP